jgi:transposase
MNQTRRHLGRARVTLSGIRYYSPELNPTENVWEYLRQNKLSIRVFDSYEAIVDACCDAWNDLIATPERIASIATRPWASVIK